MGLIEKDTIISRISPPVDRLLATQLVDEFISMERRFIQRDWEPAELDGGQFAEVAARILYHQDSGNLDLSRDHGDCIRYFENNAVLHQVDRKDLAHLSKVLQSIYKFRSQRGAIHISPKYMPNHMDAKYLMEAVRWCMNEMLRIFWSGDREEVAKAIKEILQFDVPCIGKFDEVIMVQRIDLNAEEEILVLLHYAGEQGFSRSELGRYCRLSPTAVTLALQALAASQKRQIVKVPNGMYRLTDLGHRRVREQLTDKLLLH